MLAQETLKCAICDDYLYLAGADAGESECGSAGDDVESRLAFAVAPETLLFHLLLIPHLLLNFHPQLGLLGLLFPSLHLAVLSLSPSPSPFPRSSLARYWVESGSGRSNLQGLGAEWGGRIERKGDGEKRPWVQEEVGEAQEEGGEGQDL